MTNVIVNNCRQTKKIITNLLKSNSNLSRKQYATTLEDYKITWTRPEKVSCLTPEKSGDQGINVDVKSSEIFHIYNESPEMKNVSDIVKRKFTLQFLPRKYTYETNKAKIINLVQRYDDDMKSPEVKIAQVTSRIHYLQKIHNEHPRNGIMKSMLKEAIDKRRSLLTKLRKKDYRCFEYTLERLNLIYKPTPEPPTQITKKESLKRLTEKHCNKIMQKKLDAYKAELKAQQKDFFAEKAEKLAFIREEEIACGLEPTVSEEDITLAKQKVM